MQISARPYHYTTLLLPRKVGCVGGIVFVEVEQIIGQCFDGWKVVDVDVGIWWGHCYVVFLSCTQNYWHHVVSTGRINTIDIS